MGPKPKKCQKSGIGTTFDGIDMMSPCRASECAEPQVPPLLTTKPPGHSTGNVLCHLILFHFHHQQSSVALPHTPDDRFRPRAPPARARYRAETPPQLVPLCPPVRELSMNYQANAGVLPHARYHWPSPTQALALPGPSSIPRHSSTSPSCLRQRLRG